MGRQAGALRSWRDLWVRRVPESCATPRSPPRQTASCSLGLWSQTAMAFAITPWSRTSTSRCRPTTAVPRPTLPAWRTTWRRRYWTCASCCRATPGPSSELCPPCPCHSQTTSDGPPTRAPLCPSPPGPAGPRPVPSTGHPQHHGLCSEAEQDRGPGAPCIARSSLPLGKEPVNSIPTSEPGKSSDSSGQSLPSGLVRTPILKRPKA